MHYIFWVKNNAKCNNALSFHSVMQKVMHYFLKVMTESLTNTYQKGGNIDHSTGKTDFISL